MAGQQAVLSGTHVTLREILGVQDLWDPFHAHK